MPPLASSRFLLLFEKTQIIYKNICIYQKKAVPLRHKRKRKESFMCSTVTVNMSLTYGQILGLAMQLPDKEKYALCRDLSSKWRTLELRSIRDSISACTLSDEEIRQECEIVRQNMYDELHVK